MYTIIVFALLSGFIHPHLQHELSIMSNQDMIDVVVHMENRADVSVLPENCTNEEKIQFLKDFASADQQDLIDWLALSDGDVSNLKSYWIFNGLSFTATKEMLLKLAARNDIEYIIDDYEIMLEESNSTELFPEMARTPEWNISKINADSCWLLGYDGNGIIVGNLDTGVDTAHPALQGKWQAGGWFDAVNGQPGPYDDHGHGTFSMGLICGGDGPGPFVDDIGVAPGINYIVAKVFNSSGGAQLSWLHAGLQWIAVEQPDIVNNPWSSTTTSLEFWDDCVTLRNVGVYPVFRIGSNGPGSGTASAPGNYPLVTGVGATDSNDDIASSSSRGPAPNQYPWNDTLYWSRPDWFLTKPDISAPGVNVRSANASGGYQVGSGTSWATAHVSGAAAILRQADSVVSYDSLYKVLLDYADQPSQGGTYPNNNYGWGRVNVLASLRELLSVEERNTRTPGETIIDFGATIIRGPLVLPKDKLCKVFDISGREVKPHLLVPGIYFIEIEGNITQKIVKVR